MILTAEDHAFIARNMDYMDVGCKAGSSTHLCQQILGGRRGFGIDINQGHIAEYSMNGGFAMHADATCTGLPDKCVDFACLSHMLEHLPSLDKVEACITEAVRLSRRFVYIVGPFFDADSYLAALNLKFFWSDWVWHPTHVTSENIIRGIKKSKGWHSAELWGRIEIFNSNSNCILHLDEAKNQHHHDPTLHLPKPVHQFNKPLHQEISCIIAIDPDLDLPSLRKKLKLSKRLSVLQG